RYFHVTGVQTCALPICRRQSVHYDRDTVIRHTILLDQATLDFPCYSNDVLCSEVGPSTVLACIARPPIGLTVLCDDKRCARAERSVCRGKRARVHMSMHQAKLPLTHEPCKPPCILEAQATLD